MVGEGSICVCINVELWYNMYAVDWLPLPSPDVYVEALIKSVMIFGREAFGK